MSGECHKLTHATQQIASLIRWPAQDPRAPQADSTNRNRGRQGFRQLNTTRPNWLATTASSAAAPKCHTSTMMLISPAWKIRSPKFTIAATASAANPNDKRGSIGAPRRNIAIISAAGIRPRMIAAGAQSQSARTFRPPAPNSIQSWRQPLPRLNNQMPSGISGES